MSKSRDASRYRDDAARFRQRAAAASDDADLRNSYLAAAREFDRLADLLEEKLRSPAAPKSADTQRTWLRMSRRRDRQRHRGTPETLAAPEGMADAAQPAAVRRMTVLLIDADPAVRISVKSILAPAGLTVIALPDAAAALERLAALRADLVLCDIGASAPDGRSAIDAIAEIDPAAQILALVPKHRDRAASSPCIGTALEKPFTPSELLRTVRRALIGSPPCGPSFICG